MWRPGAEPPPREPIQPTEEYPELTPGRPLLPEDGITLSRPWQHGPDDNKWLRSLVVRYLHDIWGASSLVPDSVGEYRFQVGVAECWVSVHDFMKPATVEVFARAATGVPLSGRLMLEINELNRDSELATVSWSEGVVMVKYSIFGTTIDRDQLRHVCSTLGRTADHVGTVMASRFGGSTPF